MSSPATMQDVNSSASSASSVPQTNQQNPLPDQTPDAQPSQRVVPISGLRPLPQHIDCPKCHKIAETKVQGRSKKMKKFMNVFWWPLPGRQEWWETMHWYCGECNEEVASQKSGKEIRPLQ